MSGDAAVDASLAAKWVLVGERHRPEARSLLFEWTRDDVRVVVPSWFVCEIGNILYRRVVRGELTLEDGQRGVSDVLASVHIVDVEPQISLRALEWAHILGQAASYDSQYLALAEYLDCELWTADERFWNAARTSCPWVRWIGEYRIAETAKPSEP